MIKLLEIIVLDAEGAAAAQEGCADHLEVVRDLHIGGLTPDLETLKVIRDRVKMHLNVMVRPHARDFVYSPTEMELILRDAEQVVRLGADGVVFGALTPHGEAHIAQFRQVAEACRSVNPQIVMTFHRAIEEVREPDAALTALIGLADRVLASGFSRVSATAAGERALLRAWVQRYGKDIHFACGSGVTLDNIRQIALSTGAQEYHVGTGAQTDGKVDQRKVEALVKVLASLE